MGRGAEMAEERCGGGLFFGCVVGSVVGETNHIFPI
jgi:hypothetical protein